MRRGVVRRLDKPLLSDPSASPSAPRSWAAYNEFVKGAIHSLKAAYTGKPEDAPPHRDAFKQAGERGGGRTCAAPTRPAPAPRLAAASTAQRASPQLAGRCSPPAQLADHSPPPRVRPAPPATLSGAVECYECRGPTGLHSQACRLRHARGLGSGVLERMPAPVLAAAAGPRRSGRPSRGPGCILPAAARAARRRCPPAASS